MTPATGTALPAAAFALGETPAGTVGTIDLRADVERVVARGDDRVGS
jgi:hypothetical protein